MHYAYISMTRTFSCNDEILRGNHITLSQQTQCYANITEKISFYIQHTKLKHYGSVTICRKKTQQH